MGHFVAGCLTLSTLIWLNAESFQPSRTARRPCPLSLSLIPSGDRQGDNQHSLCAECCSSPAGKEEEETGVEGTTDPLSELDPTSPITVCLRHNNVEVLQYLMFKHVWQHYLLDEVYKLPHNSQVPDLGPEHLLNACHQCYWFLHCAALVGCSYLLDQVIWFISTTILHRFFLHYILTIFFPLHILIMPFPPQSFGNWFCSTSLSQWFYLQSTHNGFSSSTYLQWFYLTNSHMMILPPQYFHNGFTSTTLLQLFYFPGNVTVGFSSVSL